MFTGIVEEIGTIRRIAPTKLLVAAHKVLGDLGLGDSIAVNGVCLTVTERSADTFAVEVMPETLRRSNIGLLRANDRVNLERALAPSGRIGGHFVQGHVDGTGQVAQVSRDEDALLVRVDALPAILRYVVEKGFIAVDGTSLTVVDIDERGFVVSLVEFTQQNVVLSERKPGDRVNLEVDILGKYVERFVAGGKGPKISEEFLAQNGFI